MRIEHLALAGMAIATSEGEGEFVEKAASVNVKGIMTL